MSVSHDWSLHLIRKSGAEPEQQLAAALLAGAREACSAGDADSCEWLRSCGVAYLSLICPAEVDEWAVLERIMAGLPERKPSRGWREDAARFVQMVLSIPLSMEAR